MIPLPVLKSGAPAQYPVSHVIRFSTRVIEFIDGSIQSYSDRGLPFQEIHLAYDTVTAAEAHELERTIAEAKDQSVKVTLSNLPEGLGTEKKHPSDALVITYEGYDRANTSLSLLD